MKSEALTKGIYGCACGRNHICPIEHITIGNGVLDDLPRLCKPYGHILLVCDTHTYRAVGARAEELLHGVLTGVCVLPDNGDVVIPDEDTIARIEAALTGKETLILGVGSGVINDLCKHVSFLHDLPYFIVATAPSMDGFASVGAALILNGMKVTRNARPPRAILADTGVLKNAPLDMIRAGYGDIIGKFSCLNDWRLAALVRGEYFCQTVYDLTMETAKNVRNLAAGLQSREEQAVGELMDALVTVGVAMAYVGTSRPASGSEHHLSHFFEITGILEKKPYFAHGIDVAYSSVLTARLRREITAQEPCRKPFDRVFWEKEIRRVYGTSADGVIALQNKLGWYERDEEAFLQAHWDEVRAVLADSPSPEEFEDMIAAVGLDFAQMEPMYGAQKLADALLYARDLKDRYTVLWLYGRYV